MGEGEGQGGCPLAEVGRLEFLGTLRKGLLTGHCAELLLGGASQVILLMLEEGQLGREARTGGSLQMIGDTSCISL